MPSKKTVFILMAKPQDLELKEKGREAVRRVYG